MPAPELEQLGINVVRGLAMDAPLKANSGHQGTAMALAPLAHVLFTRILNFDATDPSWPDRDRFILSGGHASILLYSMLYLTGHGLELDDLKQFRQWESLTPGHPEAGHTAGVEVTTGPLGQGLGNAVGMALTERYLRATFGAELCDHYTYVTCGDGDLSEGVSHEAASLAGHLGLDRLIAVYDDNYITIDGPTGLALTDNAPDRFASYGWDVINLGEAANDLDRLTAALQQAKANTTQPSLVIVRSHIGYPSPNLTDDHAAHGNPFDEAETAATKSVMGLPPEEHFWVPEEVLAMYRQAGRRGTERRRQWEERLDQSALKQQWYDHWHSDGKELQAVALAAAAGFEVGSSTATRKASQAVLSALADASRRLIGGSADLTGNTGTEIDSTANTPASPEGRQIYFGVREHAMGATLVGAACHGGVIPVGGTFLVFSDYMRPSVRLAAMSQARCLFVWTHDSVGVGEDGPTHQPVEQIMSLRAIPGLLVIRPADAIETAGAWAAALDHDGPSALVLSRQNLPVLEGTNAELVRRGAYKLVHRPNAQVSLIGTGSEVSLCVEAARLLEAEGTTAEVVSMPSWELFEQLSVGERNAVLDPHRPAVSVEAGVTLGWDRYATATIGIDRFGASAPGVKVLTNLGMNTHNVVSVTKQLLTSLGV